MKKQKNIRRFIDPIQKAPKTISIQSSPVWLITTTKRLQANFIATKIVEETGARYLTLQAQKPFNYKLTFVLTFSIASPMHARHSIHKKKQPTK